MVRNLAALVFMGFCLVGACGCGSGDTARPPTVFVVEVDSIVAPIQISTVDTLTLAIYGRIGSNLCFRFKEFDVERTQSQLDLTVLGIVPDLRGRECATAISELRREDGRRGKEFNVVPPIVDPFKVVVHQPDGSTLEKTVRVLAVK